MIRTTAILLVLVSTPALACNWIADPDGCYVQAKAIEDSNKAGKAAMDRHIDQIYAEHNAYVESLQRSADANKLNGTLEIQSIFRPMER